ncbi:hypothetical protein FGG08_001818 [Glutinoglossum americanum]|uniref:Bms1-type G domain-containing protein n=1 Tax=Glutinoglossum americanum TaxID=1670608 RepID=A0A9P8I624_9PEZI|nr:hypothetical protein FGG08_001818 [Glutinoglossum americanum]
MVASTGVHHHRSTAKASNKSFKSRKATKGSLKELAKGRVEGLDKNHRRSPHQQLVSKLDRRNQARQKQRLKYQESVKASSLFCGRDGAPRIVALVPLCKNGKAQRAAQKLNECLDLDLDVPEEGLVRLNVERFKQKIEYVLVKRDLITALDACRVADFVVFILSPDLEVDELGELLIRSIENQGISNVLTVVQGLDTIETLKRRQQIISSLKSYISHFFPTIEKIHSLDDRQDCSNILRSLCSINPKGIGWREKRSWMLVEEALWLDGEESVQNEDTIGVVLTGVVRGMGLSADRLVQVGDWGEFQIEKIAASAVGHSKNSQSGEMVVGDDGEEKILLEPTIDQDDLADLALEEVIMAGTNDGPDPETATERKGVLLDDHHYFSDDESHIPPPPKRLPKGTSSYQSAWYLDDVSDSESDLDEPEDQDGDIFMAPPALPQDGVEGLDLANQCEPTEYTPSEAPRSDLFLDPSPEDEAEQLAAFRSRQDEVKDDLEFPDEIELHPGVLARERLTRYRGLKNLRTSHWETEEDRVHEPEEWGRLLRVIDHKKARNRAEREALVGGVQPGARVCVYLRNVPASVKTSYSPSRPLALFSLLRHEHKRAVVNFSITLNSDHSSPIKSKEEILLQCGPRRWTINPLISQPGNTPNNVHKFDRYLHPSRTAIATFMGPLTWGSVPSLFFKRTVIPSDGMGCREGLQLIGTGTSLPPDHSRVIAKRIILTGHPYKIHKKLVTVRYMFFNAEDVNWFKALQLWTKRGRSGYIKESLGTHGYFKATFDGKINPQDSVGVSLYKRVFPRNSRPWRAGLDEA